MSTPAISTFGRGLKGNGNNQTVQSATWAELGMTTSPTKFTIFLTIHSGTIGKVFSTGYTSSYSGLALTATPTGFIFESNKTENAVLNIPAEKGDVVITFDNNVYSFYVNTVLVAQEEFIYTVPLKWGAGEKLYVLSYRDSSSFSDALVSNIGVIDDVVLTPDQIEYLHKLPHKFLYPEKVVNPDGSANWFPKSFILPQSTLDKVKVHMPMTDTDDYARNMIGYSEVEKPTAPDFSSIGNWSMLDGSTVTNGALNVTSDINGGAYLTGLTSGYYLIEVVIGEYTLGNPRVYMENTAVGKASLDTSKVGVPQWFILYNASATRFYIQNFYVVGGDFKIDTSSVKQLSGTYPIQNYTDSCRSEAINLPYGLQTSSWKRDILGVPYAGSFDALQMDGTQVPALRLPMTDTELWEGEFFQIEMVISRELIVENLYILFSLSNLKGLSLVVNASWNSSAVMLQLFDGSIAANLIKSGIDENLHHIVFTVTPTEMYMTAGGVKGTAVVHSFVPSGLNFADSTRVSPTGQLRLFKIHKEYQDETKLYNKAVNAGLLN